MLDVYMIITLPFLSVPERLCLEDYIALQEIIVPIVVGGVLGILLVLIFIAYVIAYARRRRREAKYEPVGDYWLQAFIPIVSEYIQCLHVHYTNYICVWIAVCPVVIGCAVALRVMLCTNTSSEMNLISDDPQLVAYL